MSAADPEKKVYRLSINFQRFAQIIKPDTRCQVCLSDQNEFNNEKGNHDRLIQCSLCLGTIHQTHYGSELLTSTPLEWHCQRCSYLLKLRDPEVNFIPCDYCPVKTGIMKQVEYEKKKHWIHPECVIWDFPVRFFPNKSFESIRKTAKLAAASDQFWYREFPNRRCRVCGLTNGEFVKCRYYNCEVHYHATCGRMAGVMRQLEKMRVQQADIYMPVYCTEHLQMRVKDFKQKSDKQKNKQKHKRLLELSQIYQHQLANLRKSKIFEQTLHTRSIVEFTYEDEQKSIEQENSSSASADEVVQREPTHYDSSLCEYLEKELDGCLLNNNSNAFKKVAEIAIPMEEEEGQRDGEDGEEMDEEQLRDKEKEEEEREEDREESREEEVDGPVIPKQAKEEKEQERDEEAERAELAAQFDQPEEEPEQPKKQHSLEEQEQQHQHHPQEQTIKQQKIEIENQRNDKMIIETEELEIEKPQELVRHSKSYSSEDQNMLLALQGDMIMQDQIDPHEGHL